MKDWEQKVIDLTKEELLKINAEIDSIAFIRSNNQNVLNITLVSTTTSIIDLDLITVASKHIKEILDKEDFIKTYYILDCHSRVGGNFYE